MYFVVTQPPPTHELFVTEINICDMKIIESLLEGSVSQKVVDFVRQFNKHICHTQKSFSPPPPAISHLELFVTHDNYL